MNRGIEERLRQEAPDDPRYEARRIRSRLQAEAGGAHGRSAHVAPRMGEGLRLSGVLAAVVIMAVAVVVLRTQAVGPASPADGALSDVRASGVLRVAVRAEVPQARLPGGGVDGFDVDLAREVAERLGVTVEVVVLPSTEMLGRAERWDVAIAQDPDAATFTATRELYRWPHMLLVAAPGSSSASLAGKPACASAAADRAWLRTVVRADPVPAASDHECIATLERGDVVAVVTAELTPSDIATRPNLVRLPGGPAEPRHLVVAGGERAASLRDALDRIVEQMLDEGTVRELSQSRFGGTDLSPSGREDVEP